MRRLGGGEGMASIARSRRRTPFCQRGAMEKEKTYNGFTNYETWAVSLWLGNEYASYQYWRDVAREEWKRAKSAALPGGFTKGTDGNHPAGISGDDGGRAATRSRFESATSHLTPREAAILNLADRLREEIADDSPLTAASLYSDLLQTALSEVDWYEIADNLLHEAQEEDEA